MCVIHVESNGIGFIVIVYEQKMSLSTVYGNNRNYAMSMQETEK